MKIVQSWAVKIDMYLTRNSGLSLQHQVKQALWCVDSQEVPKHQVGNANLSISLCHAPLSVLEADLIKSPHGGAVHTGVTAPR